MGYTVIQAQYLSIPVYIFGGLAFLTAAYISDRYCIRGPLLWLTNLPGIVGYVLIICSAHGKNQRFPRLNPFCNAVFL